MEEDGHQWRASGSSGGQGPSTEVVDLSHENDTDTIGTSAGDGSIEDSDSEEWEEGGEGSKELSDEWRVEPEGESSSDWESGLVAEEEDSGNHESFG